MSEFEHSQVSNPQSTNLVIHAEKYIEAVDSLQTLLTHLDFAKFRHVETVEPYLDKWFPILHPEVMRSTLSLGGEVLHAIGIAATEMPIAFIKKRQLGKAIGKDNVTVTNAKYIVQNQH
jgi:hypothetical protein